MCKSVPTAKDLPDYIFARDVECLLLLSTMSRDDLLSLKAIDKDSRSAANQAFRGVDSHHNACSRYPTQMTRFPAKPLDSQGRTPKTSLRIRFMNEELKWRCFFLLRHCLRVFWCRIYNSLA